MLPPFASLDDPYLNAPPLLEVWNSLNVTIIEHIHSFITNAQFAVMAYQNYILKWQVTNRRPPLLQLLQLIGFHFPRIRLPFLSLFFNLPRWRYWWSWSDDTPHILVIISATTATAKKEVMHSTEEGWIVVVVIGGVGVCTRNTISSLNNSRCTSICRQFEIMCILCHEDTLTSIVVSMRHYGKARGGRSCRWFIASSWIDGEDTAIPSSFSYVYNPMTCCRCTTTSSNAAFTL